MTDPTLTEALAALGYTHRRASDCATTRRHEIVDGAGRVVASLSAREAWAWLREGRST